ncbi:MAG: ABC transporter ATP-binding protein [Bacilli bacterium]|nr:ABC transporter ATP-binding protein [Bacilli bacterium]
MKKSLKEFKPLWEFVKEDKFRIIIASILIFITELADTLAGYLNGQVVESITKLNIERSLIFLGIYLFINIVIDNYMYVKSSAMLQKVENKVSRRLSFKTYRKALDLPAYAYEKTSSGEVINRVTNDADSLSFAFGRLLQMFSSIVGAIVIIVYVFINSWIIGLEILLFVFLLFLIIKKYNPLLISIHKERKKEQDKFSSIVNESIRGVREIKTLGVKKNLIDDTRKIIKNIFKKSNEEIDTNSKYKILNKFVRAFLEASVFGTCLVLMYYGKITLSFFIAMTYYVYRFMWLIDEVNSFTETYQKLYVSLSRVNEIVENKLYPDEKFGEKRINNIEGVIEFRNIKFGYPNEGILLDNFNLKIEPHKKIAVVGKSGQGKSTIFNLLTRIFDPIDGEVLIDNVNINELSEKELRNKISIIRQEPFIFNRTIFDNFRLINKNITLKEVRKYTKMAFLDDYIMSLPQKYNTVLGEGGVNLSGGQKQRLSIARALAKNSKIVLFDEATSALDNNSQEYVKETIDNLVKDHTIVIVAHRLSTIMDADIIYVVDKGKVVDSGTHKELLKNSNIYKNLYETESLNS